MKNWKENFANGKELVISTCSNNNIPHLNIAISLGFVDDKLLIADCHMQTTLSNLIENPQVSIISGYLRIKGEVSIYNNGEYLEICIEDCKDIPDNPKNALLVDINEIYNLDTGEKIL